MKDLIKFVSGALLFLSIDLINPVLSFNKDIKSLSSKIEEALNKGDIPTLDKLIKNKDNKQKLTNKYKKLLKKFQNLKWEITIFKQQENDQAILEIKIASKETNKSQKYYLDAKQIIEITTNKQAISSHELISEYSIISDTKNKLPIRLNIPDEVLTGTRYDADIILENPLGDSIIAGGLISVSSSDVINQISPNIELQPINGGGIFKIIQAPMLPGSQRLAGTIAHPEGIISITKYIRVVSK